MAFAFRNVVAMSSDEEYVIGGDVPADESTDDEVGDEIVLRRVGVLRPRPCLCVRIVHKFLLNRFFKPTIKICVITHTTLSTQILCLKLETACAYLGMPLSDRVFSTLKKMRERDDVKMFLKVQAGEFLHRIIPSQVVSYRFVNS